MLEQLQPHQRAQFEQLRARFLAGLPGRWQAIAQASSDADRLARLHQLTGAAGAYGENGLSQAARDAEHAVARQGDISTALAALGECIHALAPAATMPEGRCAHNPVAGLPVSQSHDT
jgi:hypothetical protein